MEMYYQLQDEAENYGFTILENHPIESDGDGVIDGKLKLIGYAEHVQTDVERKCILAEELNHYRYDIGDILNPKDPESRRREYRTRKRTAFELVKPRQFIDAFNAGVSSARELAEFLEITEKTLEMVIGMYQKQYGTHMMIDGYLIQFDPNLQVGKMWKNFINE